MLQCKSLELQASALTEKALSSYQYAAANPRDKISFDKVAAESPNE
ncbi:Uncharacterised protein [Campylobacter jejuni]|nr:Uncharacterised protein [Campylobacter jejuni]